LAPGGLEEYFAELASVLGAARTATVCYGLAERHGITIQDVWIEEIEQRTGVKL